MRTIESFVEEVSIELHPDFNKPRNDWRVITEHWEFDHDEDGEIISGTGVLIPEDRSKWRPEEDGKSMADFWDAENREFRDGSPLESMKGITMFLRPRIRITDLDDSLDAYKDNENHR